MSNEVTINADLSNGENFDHVQRVAKMLSSSSLIPKEYQGNIQNTIIALEMSNRIGASPMMVMQNLYIVHGKPSWSSTFIIAAINACKKFSPLRYTMEGKDDQYGCTAWAYDIETKEKLEGPKVTWAMANAEGWVNKQGSKWKTMPELMFRYRAATFFGRLYAPELLMGIRSQDEVEDIHYTEIQPTVSIPETPKFQELKDLVEAGNSVADLQVNYDIPADQLEKLTQIEMNFNQEG